MVKKALPRCCLLICKWQSLKLCFLLPGTVWRWQCYKQGERIWPLSFSFLASCLPLPCNFPLLHADNGAPTEGPTSQASWPELWLVRAAWSFGKMSSHPTNVTSVSQARLSDTAIDRPGVGCAANWCWADPTPAIFLTVQIRASCQRQPGPRFTPVCVSVLNSPKRSSLFGKGHSTLPWGFAF